MNSYGETALILACIEDHVLTLTLTLILIVACIEDHVPTNNLN